MTIKMDLIFCLVWFLSNVILAVGIPHTSEEKIEESWSWLSGGISFFITGVLINIIMILLLCIACNIAENLHKRESGQITNNAL
ncbi:Uncharacterized protein APZ42_015364 [Daphnia magna]|uniref:Uncharacterized protein n=1 Tax=Daphnia magna TaxID=35525 RepID=A0A0P5HUK5_9CRUS|nr:Uncharacterized protein APZ42_015364 [Daphnia magna]